MSLSTCDIRGQVLSLNSKKRLLSISVPVFSAIFNKKARKGPL